ncbi:hypothetical protein [Methylobacterium brachiatum]
MVQGVGANGHVSGTSSRTALGLDGSYNRVYSQVRRDLSDISEQVRDLRWFAAPNENIAVSDDFTNMLERALRSCVPFRLPVLGGPLTLSRPVSNVPTGKTEGCAVRMEGDATGFGTNSAVVEGGAASNVIQVNFASTQPAVRVVSRYPSRFVNFRMDVSNDNTMRSSAGPLLSIEAPAPSKGFYSIAGTSIVDNVSFANRGELLRTVAAPIHLYRSNLTAWQIAGLHLMTYPAFKDGAGNVHQIESGTGDIAGNRFNALPGVGAAVLSEIGYTYFHHNAVIGGAYGFQWMPKNGPAGYVDIGPANSFENQNTASISAVSGDGSSGSMLKVFDNEFSNLFYANIRYSAFLGHIFVGHYGAADKPWIDTVTVTDNIVRSQALRANYQSFTIRSGRGVLDARNAITVVPGGSGQMIGHSVRAGRPGELSEVSVEDNKVWGAPADISGLYDLDINVVLRHGNLPRNPLTVSKLQAVADGSTTYVTDGTPGSSPIVGGGTGCLAIRRNGAWACQ